VREIDITIQATEHPIHTFKRPGPATANLGDVDACPIDGDKTHRANAPVAGRRSCKVIDRAKSSAALKTGEECRWP